MEAPQEIFLCSRCLVDRHRVQVLYWRGVDWYCRSCGWRKATSVLLEGEDSVRYLRVRQQVESDPRTSDG